ncbi:hypothetical protein, partial [Mesorhizobium sp. M4B.F.Ca.ET.089.01.1.1]|uniref:hypothetical protein n=1 Tax=Mesorhizobium sp. M4B.F.Ca.ET.089.01.1.1 TaxID=2496662 RepID=UPI001AECCC9E
TLACWLAGGRSWSQDSPSHKSISEEAVRTASAQRYSDLLAMECSHGRLYPRSQIERGFERHFEELRLTLIAEGYTIVPDAIANDPSRPVSEMAFDARRRLGFASQAGCLAPYWLEDDRDY